MSGGSLNYFYSDLREHLHDFDDLELDELVSDLSDLFFVRERYLSADRSEESWNEARKEFKEKWFTEYGRVDRINRYLTDLRRDLFNSLGLEDSGKGVTQDV